jgi:hypothetical protein
LVSTNPYRAGKRRSRASGTLAAVFLAALHPAAPAVTPHSSVVLWVLLAVVLALVVAGGMVLTSRR